MGMQGRRGSGLGGIKMESSVLEKARLKSRSRAEVGRAEVGRADMTVHGAWSALVGLSIPGACQLSQEVNKQRDDTSPGN